MTNCGTLQPKFAATGDREVAATACELWIEAVRNRAMPVATAARLLQFGLATFRVKGCGTMEAETRGPGYRRGQLNLFELIHLACRWFLRALRGLVQRRD